MISARDIDYAAVAHLAPFVKLTGKTGWRDTFTVDATPETSPSPRHRPGAFNTDCTHKSVHMHGTRTCYVVDRCRCDDCRAANTAEAKYRERRKLYGRYDDLVDAEPVRRHVRRLMVLGMGRRRISQVSGVAMTTLSTLLYGKYATEPTHPEHRPPRRRVTKDVAEKLLAVRLDLAPGQRVDAIGTVRRLQALQVQGWSAAELAGRIGWLGPNLHAVILGRSDLVTVATHNLVETLFEELWDQLPANPRSSRVRGYALRRGWAPAAAWDDIDDPTERPKGMEAQYQRSIASIEDDVLWRLELGESPDAIARDLGIETESLERRLARRREAAA